MSSSTAPRSGSSWQEVAFADGDGPGVAGERLLVELYQAQGANDLERAHVVGHELVAIYPRSPRAWIRLARVEEASGENLEARTAANRALELDPGSGPGSASKGRWHFCMWKTARPKSGTS